MLYSVDVTNQIISTQVIIVKVQTMRENDITVKFVVINLLFRHHFLNPLFRNQ